MRREYRRRIAGQWLWLQASGVISNDSMEIPMSLLPSPIGEIPVETACVARAAFRPAQSSPGLRNEFAEVYRDEDFETLYPRRGPPALAPRRRALVAVCQFLEYPNVREAADTLAYRLTTRAGPGIGGPGLSFEPAHRVPRAAKPPHFYH